MQILTNQTSNGDSTIIDLRKMSGGDSFDVLFSAQGVWDTATATLKYSIDGGATWLDCGPDTTLGSDGGGWAKLSRGTQVKAVVSSAGASTNLNGFLQIDRRRA